MNTTNEKFGNQFAQMNNQWHDNDLLILLPIRVREINLGMNFLMHLMRNYDLGYKFTSKSDIIDD